MSKKNVTNAASTKSTKNLGDRSRVPVRVGPQVNNFAHELADMVSVPVNTIYSIAVSMMAAQFAPLLHRRGVNLDLLEEEVLTLFAEARRVIESSPPSVRKVG